MAYFNHVIVHNKDKHESELNYFTFCALKGLIYMHINFVPELEVTNGEPHPCNALSLK